MRPRQAGAAHGMGVGDVVRLHGLRPQASERCEDGRHATCSAAPMTALDQVLPTPRKLELSSVDLALPPERAWHLVRHEDLARSALVKALFALRTLPSRFTGTVEKVELRLDAIASSAEHPGFQILIDDAREVVVGAIGKVWQLDIPFVHVEDATAYAAFAEPGWVKVAWALRVSPWGEQGSRVEIEVRVDATDDASWKRFQRYWLLIGPGSHFIRRTLFSALAREHGTPEGRQDDRPLPGDALLTDAAGQLTHGITIDAAPERVWPWLLQMGGGRAGFYSLDTLDNASVPSARELHPALQSLEVGQRIPATPEGDDGFEVLAIEPERALVLGGLFDPSAKKQLPFASARPEHFWQVTWTFALEPLDGGHTRLHVRARAAFSADQRLHAAWITPVHGLMETAQLHNLKRRAEGRARDGWRDVVDGLGGASIMVAAILTPFLRSGQRRWGVDEVVAARRYPGDDRVPSPSSFWTHGIEIEAPAEAVWPWIAQIGADKGGFYSYQWLENVVGCEVKNAERVHPEWEVKVGDGLKLHPEMPALAVVEVVRGHHWLAHGAPEPAAKADGKPWVDATWLFFLEPLGPSRCRFISRYRTATSDDLAMKLAYGVAIEPIGFAMDRRMLLGVKERVERPA